MTYRRRTDVYDLNSECPIIPYLDGIRANGAKIDVLANKGPRRKKKQRRARRHSCPVIKISHQTITAHTTDSRSTKQKRIYFQRPLVGCRKLVGSCISRFCHSRNDARNCTLLVIISPSGHNLSIRHHQ